MYLIQNENVLIKLIEFGERELSWREDYWIQRWGIERVENGDKKSKSMWLNYQLSVINVNQCLTTTYMYSIYKTLKTWKASEKVTWKAETILNRSFWVALLHEYRPLYELMLDNWRTRCLALTIWVDRYRERDLWEHQLSVFVGGAEYHLNFQCHEMLYNKLEIW